jgi:hypothetical protein
MGKKGAKAKAPNPVTIVIPASSVPVVVEAKPTTCAYVALLEALSTAKAEAEAEAEVGVGGVGGRCSEISGSEILLQLQAEYRIVASAKTLSEKKERLVHSGIKPTLSI